MNLHRSFALGVLCLLLSGSALAAEENQKSTEQSSTEVEVPTITVLGQPIQTSPLDLVPTVSELSGTRLQRKRQSTVGETLSRETGVTSSFFGPNASRPVIRGLDGERIRVLQNGTGVLDASAASPDHAVALDPLAVERFEIVRGAAALLYGPSAIGGVVNAVTTRIPEKMPEAFRGKVESRYGSVDQGRSGALVLEGGALDKWTYHIDGSVRASDNYRIPGFARTQALRDSSPVGPGETETSGIVPNSFNRTWNGALGTSYIFENGFAGASFANYQSAYGTVADPAVSIQMRQQRFDIAAGIKNLGWIDSIRFKNSFSDYKHDEIEEGEVGTGFKNKGDEARLELSHQKTGNFTGIFGLQTNIFKFEAMGDEAFLPPTDNQIFSAFVFEQGEFGAFKPTLGLRVDGTQVKSDDTVKFGSSQSKSFTGSSASLGFLYELVPTVSVVLNTAYTERAPNYQELFANGAHLATGTFERGSVDLGKEKAKSVELSLRHKGDQTQASVGGFWQDFEDFVALSPTGQTDVDSTLPIYQFAAVPAQLYGAEVEVKHRLNGLLPGGTFDVELKADFVKGKNRTTGDNLPRMPALRETLGFIYRTDRFQTDLEIQRSEKQTDVAPNETETDAYTLVNFGVEAPIRWEKTTLSVFARVNNILDVEARTHVSLVKDIAPLPGRNFVAGLHATF